MTTFYGQQYEDVLSDVSTLMASARLSQRQSRDSGTYSSIHSTRSSRVEKPRSTNNSPRAIDRRRTTSGMRSYQGHSRNPTMATTYDNSQVSYVEASIPTTRPMSWHPASSQFNGTFLQEPTTTGLEKQYYSQVSPPIMASHPASMSTPIYPNGTGIPSTYSLPLESSTYQTTPYESPYYEGALHPYSDIDTLYSSAYPSSPANTSWYMSDWPVTSHSIPQTQYPVLQSQQDFLPIQHPPELEEDDVPRTPPPEELERSDSKELIGMGLYDPPATPPHPFMSALSQGKGLKLEESWVPPPDSDDEEDAEDDGEEDEQPKNQPTSVVNGLPAAAHNVALQIQSQSQWPVVAQTQAMPQTGVVQSNLQGQTFFFEDGEGVDSEWWYQQLKNPAARISTASQGIGYGWLGA
ncbi:hypothetical protein NA57DRAFT_50742 [Rhizodiscina lignyota]|uniref:Uncharacterized protein n=1 Tax=Rhizodiscina lignyota TaxID=1504668 RepID=A0A9P4ILS3_9PEZI|nr:hypothetical protein NA57DRAFT_50742 [Rhizodiscina lignyota]